MFTSSIKTIAPAIATYTSNSVSDLAAHFQGCSRKRFSGRLDFSVLNHAEPRWSFFFHQGQLVWGVGELHPLRRWNRQLLQYCPDLAIDLTEYADPQHWNPEALVSLVKQGQLQQNTVSAIVIGNLLELLFDAIQAAQVHPTAKLQLTYRLAPPVVTRVAIAPERAWRRAEQAWSIWQQSGLARFSPNLAPIVCDDAELRQQTSLLVYRNLTALAGGCWTLRDIAVKLKQPLAPLMRSLLPFVKGGVIGLNAIDDLRYPKPVDSPLVAYIEDSRFDSAAMAHILDQAGYRFVSIGDAIQAIPLLLQHKPDLIFLDLLMPIANGYEVCGQIRRITAFQNTPIVILTSSDGIVDRVRAKLVGASGFLAKPIDPNQVVDALQQYLPSVPISL